MAQLNMVTYRGSLFDDEEKPMKTRQEIKDRIAHLQNFVDNPNEQVTELKYHRVLEIEQLKWVLGEI